MLAILGLMGVTLSAVMFIGTDDEELPENTLPAEDPDDPSIEIQRLDDIAGLSDDNIVIFSGNEDDTVQSGAGDDYIDGENGNDHLAGGAGNDTIQGGRGDDTIAGDAGDDMLNGHIGNDMIAGDAGDDALNGGGGNDMLMGGAGNDALLGSLDNDILVGGAGADTLHGGSGNDMLYDRGDDMRDYLNGGAGDDILMGGTGDNLHGGTGADTFKLMVDNNATVEDFNPAEDIIEIAFDGAVPLLTTSLSDAGLMLLADGEVVATFTNLIDLDLVAVSLRPAQ